LIDIFSRLLHKKPNNDIGLFCLSSRFYRYFTSLDNHQLDFLVFNLVLIVDDHKI
tara:strand:- start:27843 stop:28007 length:165 start_codon:yes stop_codon:yes gene_type:complete